MQKSCVPFHARIKCTLRLCTKCLADKTLLECIDGRSVVPGGFTETCIEVNLQNTDPVQCPRERYLEEMYNTQNALANDWHKCWIFEWEDEIAKAARVATHELGHIFGANDKYDGFACIVPPIESKYADLMCAHLYDQKTNSWKDAGIKYTKIGESTAKEIGWIDLDWDGTKEVYDKCPWNKEKNC